jgi:hypothetical protein
MKNETKRPIKTAGYSHAKADARKDKRRSEAKARNTAYAVLDPLVHIIARDNANLEARRERAKLYPRLFNVEIVPNKQRTA